MRLRNKPWVSEAIAEYDFVYSKERPADETQRGRWREVMGVSPDTPLFVELGAGKGDFIIRLAAGHPEAAFIGIEAQQVVLYSAAKKLKETAPLLRNVRLLVFDINDLERIFAPGEVSGLFINFCDPWPKARHAKRRLTHRNFLSRYRKLLAAGGKLSFKTDNRPLFDFSLEEFRAAGLRVEDISYDLHGENHPDNIETEYERKFSRLGEKINRCEVYFP